VPAHRAFEYAVVRVVPRVEREEFLNVGVILYCKALRFLAARVHVDEARLKAVFPDIDVDEVRRHLDHFVRVAQGGADAGPIGELSQAERFRWLSAPRSTIIQMSPAHAGLCADPANTLDHLMATRVLSPARPQ